MFTTGDAHACAGIDLDDLVGPIGYFGFTSATAAASATHEILDWSLSVTPATTLSTTNPAAGDQFGTDVAVSGSALIGGAPFKDEPFGSPFQRPGTDAGEAPIFDLSTSTVEYVRAISQVANHFDLFGYAVDVDGDRLAVSAIGDDESATAAGVVYVFERTGPGAAWTLSDIITSPEPA